ncbi:MAG: threonine ammonia-lyase [Desulfuromonadales bacterium]|nr:threonine ammonia-lyase [Desulfuromonadales bacterium]
MVTPPDPPNAPYPLLPYSLIREAADRLVSRIRRTELILSHPFSDRIGLPVYFKCENLQRTGSFKIRGALNFLLCQPREALERGVMTASAGNHGQGVAFAARLLGINSAVFMPENTPLQKVHAVRDHGAEIVLVGRNFDEAKAAALVRRDETGSLFVHPFEEPLVMAGQGTIGLEILSELPDLSTVIVPIGGGGLISGIATAIRETRPKVRIIGVETAAAPAMHYSLKKGHLMETPVGMSLADGIAIKRPGESTFRIIRELVDEVVLVEEEEIAQAIVLLLEQSKLLVEGAGAVSLAALLHGKIAKPSGKTVCILSGGNIDVKTIATVVERGLVAGGRYLKLKVELADIPGSLARLATDIAATRANIYYINHDRRSLALPIGRTEVILELETRGYEHIREVIDRLEGKGYEVTAVK